MTRAIADIGPLVVFLDVRAPHHSWAQETATSADRCGRLHGSELRDDPAIAVRDLHPTQTSAGRRSCVRSYDMLAVAAAAAVRDSVPDDVGDATEDAGPETGEPEASRADRDDTARTRSATSFHSLLASPPLTTPS
jgi:hypothetical protein